MDDLNLRLNYYPTENKQYLYDSHLHPEYFEKEILYEYDDARFQWFDKFMKNLEALLIEYNVKKNTATHFGSSNGRISFELTKYFNQVDFYLILFSIIN